MADTRTDVLVAAHPGIEAATRDFDGLMQIVSDKQVAIEGAILVTHDADGQVTVIQHGDHLDRKRLGWGPGAGLVVGMFAPLLLGSVVAGAVAGGLIGKFTDHPAGAITVKMLFEADKLKPGAGGERDSMGERPADRRASAGAHGAHRLLLLLGHGHQP